MNWLSRRAALKRLGGLVAASGALDLLVRAPFAQEQTGRIIEIVAQRFRYTPNTIQVKRGEAVILAIRALDFAHGFNLPDLKIRADLIPGQTVNVRIQPMQAGKFTFLCDNFCGNGHEEMNGTLIVET